MSWKNSFPKGNVYYEEDNGILYCEDCLNILKDIKENSVDLVVTSPPYDTARFYSAKDESEFKEIWNFEKFKKIAKEIYRVMKDGGVVVWVIGDITIKGSETGTSFKQALFFKDECGFKLHDTMIYQKTGFSKPASNRYHQNFEYMFVFVKGKLKTFNPLMDRKNKYAGETCWGKNTIRQKDGTLKERKNKPVISEFGKRYNIWRYVCGGGIGQKDKVAYKHPATFPEQLAIDHILSWSNEGDIVLDPFIGSGTTAVACEKLNRRWVGIEINESYCEIVKERVSKIGNRMF